jgi:hypothetical protein
MIRLPARRHFCCGGASFVLANTDAYLLRYAQLRFLLSSLVGQTGVGGTPLLIQVVKVPSLLVIQVKAGECRAVGKGDMIMRPVLRAGHSDTMSTWYDSIAG